MTEALGQLGTVQLMGFPEGHVPPRLTDLRPRVRRYPGATAVLIQESGSSRNIGAIYDSAGELISDTQRAKPLRGWFPSFPTLPPGNTEERLNGAVYYAGRYVSHFGHILLETLTRFWPDLNYQAFDHFLATPKFVGAGSGGNALFDSLLGFVAPNDRTVVASTRVWCEELVVASSPFHMAVTADPAFLRPFDRIADRIVRELYNDDLDRLPRRVYLSRSLLTKRRSDRQRSADNEVAIEAMMRERGFAIMHPQSHPFHEQIAACRRAEVIAGCDGSALHLAMFARPGARLLALDSRFVRNQMLIDLARGIHSVHVWAATKESEKRVRSWTIDRSAVADAIDLVLSD